MQLISKVLFKIYDMIIIFIIAVAVSISQMSYILTFFMGNKIKYAHIGFTCYIITKLFLLRGVKVEYRGLENLKTTGKAIYAGNHQSMIETFIFFIKLKKANYVFKEELIYRPSAYFTYIITKGIALNRSKPVQAIKRLIKGAKVCDKEEMQMVIFPTGTRNKPGTRESFNPGVYSIYTIMKTDLIPVATNSGLFVGKGLPMNKGTCIIEFLPAIKKDEFTNKKEFLKHLEKVVYDKADELCTEAIKKNPNLKENYFKKED